MWFKENCENNIVTEKGFVSEREISDIMQFLVNIATKYRESKQRTRTVLESESAQNRSEFAYELKNSSHYWEMKPLLFTSFTHFTALININTFVPWKNSLSLSLSLSAVLWTLAAFSVS
jgi:hypothetical protein